MVLSFADAERAKDEEGARRRQAEDDSLRRQEAEPRQHASSAWVAAPQRQSPRGGRRCHRLHRRW